MINLLIPFLTSPKFLVGAAIAVAAGVAGFKASSLLCESKVNDLKDKIVAFEREQARLVAENLILEKKAGEVTIEVVTKYIEKVTVVTEKGDEIIKEVPFYVTEKANSGCTITDGWVYNHNRAAAGTATSRLPEAPRDVDAATSGIELSDSSATIAENYKRYHQVATQLKALQDWIRKQEANSNSK
jgi:hypothetical protein